MFACHVKDCVMHNILKKNLPDGDNHHVPTLATHLLGKLPEYQTVDPRGLLIHEMKRRLVQGKYSGSIVFHRLAAVSTELVARISVERKTSAYSQ